MVAALGSFGLLALLLRRLVTCVPAALAAAAAVCLSFTFWSQAIIAEVYVLNCCVWLACLYVADSYVRSGGGRKLVGLALLGGLGLANHWPLFVLAAPSVVLWLLPAWAQLRTDLAQRWPLCLGAGLLGLLPYVHLVLASTESARFFDGRLLDSLWDYVSRESFNVHDQASQHPRWNQRLAGAGQAVLGIGREFAWVGGVLGLWGLWLCRQRLHGWQLAALWWALLAVTFVLALYRPYLPQSALSSQIFANYGLTAFAAAAIPLAYALARIMARMNLPLQWCTGASLVLTLAAWHFPQVDRSADDLARRHARLVNATLPANTRILLGTGSYGFGLDFFKFLDPAASRSNPVPVAAYLGAQYALEQLPQLLERDGVPVALAPMLQAPGVPVSWHGSHALYDPAGSKRALQLSANARELLRYAAAVRDTSNNLWTRDFADRLLFEFARRLDGAAVEQDLALFNELAATPALRYAALLTQLDAAASPVQVAAQIQRLGDLRQYPLQWRTDILHILASAHYRSGALGQAIDVLETALAGFPAATNTRVLTDLLVLLAQDGNFVRYAFLRRRYPALPAANLAGFDQRCAANLKRACTP